MHVEYWLQAATFTRVICTTTAQLLSTALHYHRNLTRDEPFGPHVSEEPPASQGALPVSLDQALQDRQGADPGTAVLHPTLLRGGCSV